jgi:nicotinamide riboside kinase
VSNKPAETKLLGIVGPCSAGKSTLINQLRESGYNCKHIAQEHSFVPDMWQKLVNPRALIYLDVSYETSMSRRKLNLTPLEFQEQENRLSHARDHAQIYVDTNPLTIGEVFHTVVESLNELSIFPESGA